MSNSSIHIDYFEALARLTRNQKAELKDFSEAVEEVTQTAVDTLKVASINLWLVDKEKNQIKCVAHSQKSITAVSNNNLKNERMPIYLSKMKEGELIISDDVYEDEFLEELIETYFKPNSITSIIDIPIHIEGELKAILCCNHCGERREWKIREQQFVLAIGNIIALLLEIWEHKQTEQRLIHNDNLLRGINSCIFQLFTNPNFKEGMDTTVSTIGKATQTDRVFIFQNFLDAEREQCCKIIHEWTSRPEYEQIHKSEWQNVNYRLAGLERWRKQLEEGKGIKNIGDQLTSLDKYFLWSKHAKSTLIVPIFINENDFWGFVGLEDCSGKHVWTITEESFIFNLAITIGGILTKQHVENLLKEKNNQLKKTNDELDQFVYSVSHDLRAPLTSVMGILQVLKTDISNLSNIQMYLELISKSVIRLDNYIREVLSISRNSRTTIKSETVDIEELIEEIKQDLTYLEDYKEVEVNLCMDEKTRQTPFKSDRIRLKAIFDNLISNSIRYHNPYQEKSFVKVMVDIDEHTAKVKVIDNGLGISKKHLPSIFDMFYRANDRKMGSGLGLYIVKETVLKLKGEIDVESIPNEGTAFTIILPNRAE
ncbi:GAF domain-containing sensor histidine kinase [Bernardetia sp.]|uniref:GAF domain-containing sensor histidine kinase n=1 Tax=Bernardetia sp. TaxID=1937974 RepID=UPI0025C5B994|nr:GAF domain-containing sensor histidine kinase [Bernardetia sp.]